jgi:hypothetical protein
MLYSPPYSILMNMKRAPNLHRILNVSSKITKPRVDLTRGYMQGYGFEKPIPYSSEDSASCVIPKGAWELYKGLPRLGLCLLRETPAGS